MELIRPFNIIDVTLTSSNVSETDETEWTTANVVIGDVRMVTTTANGASVATHDIYTANINQTPGIDPTLAANQGTGNGWDKTSTTNRFEMFNEVLQEQTNIVSTDGNIDLPGGVGDHGSTPDSVLNSSYDGLDLKIKLNLDDFTPVNAEVIASKWLTTGNQRSWYVGFQSGSTGRIQYGRSANGSTTIIVTPTGALPITATWLRIRHLFDNGVGQDVVTYEWSADTTKDSSQVIWAQFGTVIVPFGAASIFDSTAKIVVGAFETGGDSLSGSIEILEVYNNETEVGGIIVSDFNVERDYDSGNTMNSPLTAIDLPGGSGDFGSSPTSAVLNGLSKLEVIVTNLMLLDYSPASTFNIWGKFTATGNQRSVIVAIGGTGNMRFTPSVDGLASPTTQSSVTLPTAGILDGDKIDLKYSWDGSEVTFSYRLSSSSVWIELGTAQANTTASIFSSTAKYNIGALNDGTADVLTGNIGGVQIFDEPDGTIIQNFNPFRDYVSGNTMTSSTTGEVYTANGNAKFVGQWTVNGNATFNDIDGIDVSLVTNERVDSIALFNLEANEVRITQTDSVDGVVLDETILLPSYAGINNWYAYYYEPIVRDTKALSVNLLPYPAATIRVRINEEIEAKCGALVLGRLFNLGDAQYGANFSIRDFSQKTTNETTGAVTITLGNHRDLADINVQINTDRFNIINNVLTSIKSIPIVWITEESIIETMLYGYWRSWNMAITGPTRSTTLLTIESLT